MRTTKCADLTLGLCVLPQCRITAISLSTLLPFVNRSDQCEGDCYSIQKRSGSATNVYAWFPRRETEYSVALLHMHLGCDSILHVGSSSSSLAGNAFRCESRIGIERCDRNQMLPNTHNSVSSSTCHAAEVAS